MASERKVLSLRMCAVSALLLVLFVVVSADSPRHPIDPNNEIVQEVAEWASDIIKKEFALGQSNLNRVIEGTRQTFDGVLYALKIELITREERVQFAVEVFKDMGGGMAMRSFKKLKSVPRGFEQWQKEQRNEL
eukprot:TRINITY_DN557_c0_g1_i2.p1 TRINITY_DN557_c0_g1~~TRINITY_DN557_c0_g1_i2.p1  ORF type:complete len:154 (+),score=55.75 TRINITY_DN557_c0_g1_i2:63-464(+)